MRGRTSNPDRPQTRYALSTDVSIAYQVIGAGDRDVVLIPGFPSHLEHSWEHPRLSYFYRQLASIGRLVLLDKRGVGMSDRVSSEQLPGIEQRKDDVLAIQEQVRSLDVRMRTGIHTSEVEFAGDDVVGVGVHIAARLMSVATADQIIVSGVVRDLAFGSGFEFHDEGERELKGISGTWRTYSFESARRMVS